MMSEKAKRTLTVSKEGIENAIHEYLKNYNIVDDDTDYSININGAGISLGAEIIIYKEGYKDEN